MMKRDTLVLHRWSFHLSLIVDCVPLRDYKHANAMIATDSENSIAHLFSEQQ